jgi:protein TonB
MSRTTFRPAATLATLATALTLSLAALSSTPAHAQGADAVKRDFARTVYLHSATDVHDEQPQALLRAVVVLRVKLSEQGQWQAEVFRDNPEQPEMTQRALASVQRLPAPVGLSGPARQLLQTQGVVEAWLFQADGRFALKTLAKPQKGA